MPARIKPDELLRCVTSAMSKTPELVQCSPLSIVLATAQAASLLGIAPVRVGGALLQIKRVLDVEGYEVLLLDGGGGVVGLDEAALREQFGIGS